MTKNVWGIHAGKTGDADSLFLKGNLVAVGWSELGNLQEFKTREALKAAYAKTYPESKLGAIPIDVGQLYRFVNEIKQGDIIVYPSKATRTVHLGTITGNYFFSVEDGRAYPNRRSVDWKREIPRSEFSQGAIYEMGSAMSLFRIKTHAQEIIEALEDGKAGKRESEEELLPPDVTELAEENTEDFIIEQLSKHLKGLDFEEFVEHLLQKMGYNTRRTARGTPNVDLLAHRDELGFEPPIIKVQVKSGSGSIDVTDVAALCGELASGEFALLLTLSTFTSKALQHAQKKNNLRLIDGRELVQLIYKHYDSFDPRFKGIIPLKKQYVPDHDGDEP